MRKFFFPIKDATIYEEFTTRQSGLDEILEVGKNETGTYATRFLIQFDISALSSSIVTGTVSSSAEFDIKLYAARAERLLDTQVVSLYPISQSWKEGLGYFYQEPYEESDGVTWQRRETGSLWAASGSAFIATPTSSQVVSIPFEDFTFNATSLIRTWISGTIPNYGLVGKFSTSDEDSLSNTGRIYFFSKDTHTVFQPVLIAKWDDSSYSTGSLTAISSNNPIVYPINLKPFYKKNEIVRVDLVTREQYPTKTFSTQFTAWQNTALPVTSYYSIVDVQSQEVIIPFDAYSKISADTTGNYFTFKVEKMYPRRYYKLLIKSVIGSYEYVFDNKYIFSVSE